MASKARKSSDRDRHSRKLGERPVPFVSLLLAVPVSYAGFLVLHLLVRDVGRDRAVTTGGVVLITCTLAWLAYLIAGSRRRDPVIRWHLVASVLLAGTGGATTVAVGYPGKWIITYMVAGVGLACSWMFYRLDALRADSDEDHGNDENDLRKELGLDKTKFSKPELHYDKKGRLARVELAASHSGGDTVEAVQSALGKLESIANAPRGRSAAVGGDTANRSHVTLILQDVLKDMIPYDGPSAPGACITEPIVDALYEDHQPGLWYLAGCRPEAPTPASRLIMGMTRTGKTQLAQIDAMEMFTRKRVVIFWFDSVKGAQTVAPLRDGFDIVVADDVESGDPQLFRAGMKALKRLVGARATAMGRCGYRSWTPAVFDDPRLRMPFLYVHFEEADILCDITPEDMVYLASKGLSAGIATGYSLQRADAVSMPTGLRFNLGTRACFGCGDEYSSGFALTDGTIKAGAHPEEWGQTKPGYFYREGIGIDQKRWPRTLKGMFATDAQMAAHTAEWAPQMDKLDDLSIGVLGDWYERMKEIMDSPEQDEYVPAEPLSGANGNGHGRPVIVIDEEVDNEEREEREFKAEMASEIAEMRASGEIPADDEDPELDRIDPTRPIVIKPVAEEDEVSWPVPPEAPTKEIAEEAFDAALFALAADESLRDPRTGETVFRISTLVDRYQFRTRPWFSPRLSGVVEGKVQIRDRERRPVECTLVRDEQTLEYRLRLGPPLRQKQRQTIDVSQ